jgi:tRNA(Ile)-lysidine synthase
VEETARLLRYRALARLARRARCPAVLTAHHLDDQAETVLLGLIRGAGPDGLGGMAPESRWPLGGRGPRLLRPLLAFTRAEILSYAKQRDIPYRIDASNRDRSFFRNRLRPVLRGWERARPGFFRRAGRAAEILRDETAYWSGRLDRLERAVLRRTGDGMTIDLTRLMRYHKVEQRRLLKRLFPAADFAALERLRALAGASGPGALSLPSGGVVRKSARALLFRQGGPSHRRFDPKNAPLPVPGRVSLPDGRLAARPVKRLPPRWRRLAPRRVFVDADRLRGRRLLCRTRRPGDRFRPLGMAGRKKLQDFFVDAGVPREQRENVLVLEDKRRIVWVVGHRLAEDVKLTPATRRIVELTWEPA